MESIEGKIRFLDEKETSTGKSMYILTLEDGSKYSSFGVVPEPVKQAKLKNDLIRVTYKVKGDYRNIENVTKVADGKTEKPTVEGKLGDFKQADKVDNVDNIVSEGARIMAKCYDAITEILGHTPNKDGENAMCNSLFIYCTKEVYFNGKK